MINKEIYERVKNIPFSYGETLSLILEHNGRAISSLPEEDYIFPDNSVLRLTHTGVRLMEFLQE